MVEWLRIQRFGKRVPKYAKSRRGSSRWRDRILSFRLKTVVLSCFPEGLSTTCLRVLRGFRETPTNCACHTKGTIVAAHNLALKL